jgi:hypothetical protein
MNALQFECTKVALKQDRSGFVLTISIHPDEIPEELIRDFVGSRYGIAMVRIQDDETAQPVHNRVKKSAILCRFRGFQEWLDEIGHRGISALGASAEEKAIEHIYEVCGISSRTELNGNQHAKDKFDEMEREYDIWKDKKDPF